MEDHRPAAVIMRIIRRALSLRSSPPPPPPPPPDAAEQPPLATGLAARRRRQRQRRPRRKRTATDAAEVTLEADDAASGSGSPETHDAKNAGCLGQEATRELLLAPKNATDAKSAASSATAEPGLGITSSGSPHPLAPKNDPELRDPKNKDMIDAADPKIAEPACTVPKNAQCASTGPKNADSASSGTKNRDSNSSNPKPVAGQDALRGDGAALNVAATPTTEKKWNKVRVKKSRAPPAPPRSLPHVPSPTTAPTGRSPAFAPERPPCPPAAAAAGQCPPPAAVGLLDDLNGVDTFFGNFFEPPPEDETRLKHERYITACSTLKKGMTYCLACYLSDDRKTQAPIVNQIHEVRKHMRSEHKGSSFKCPKRACFATAVTLTDIGLHHYYAHGKQ